VHTLDTIYINRIRIEILVLQLIETEEGLMVSSLLLANPLRVATHSI